MNNINNILKKEINPKNILIILLVFVVILVYGFYIIYPKYNQYVSVKSEIETIKSELKKYKDKVKNIPQLKNNYVSINTKVKKMNSQLSHNMEDGMFLIGLNKNINKLGLELKSYSIGDVIKYETFYAIPATISLKGDYVKIKHIMSYMEEQNNMTQILDFKLNLVPVEIPEPQIIPEEKDEEGNVIKPETIIQPDVHKNTGNVDAVFKFIMYSSNDPYAVLDYDNSSLWKQGKINPFSAIQD